MYGGPRAANGVGSGVCVSALGCKTRERQERFLTDDPSGFGLFVPYITSRSLTAAPPSDHFSFLSLGRFDGIRKAVERRGRENKMREK